MIKKILIYFLCVGLLISFDAYGAEKDELKHTDQEDYYFLIRLARTIDHERVSDSLFSIVKRTKRSQSYPIEFRRLKPEDRVFLESLADSVNDPAVKDRLYSVARKIPSKT